MWFWNSMNLMIKCCPQYSRSDRRIAEAEEGTSICQQAGVYRSRGRWMGALLLPCYRSSEAKSYVAHQWTHCCQCMEKNYQVYGSGTKMISYSSGSTLQTYVRWYVPLRYTEDSSVRYRQNWSHRSQLRWRGCRQVWIEDYSASWRLPWSVEELSKT